MSVFHISKDLSLPRDCVTWVLAFLAKRGAGKTYDSAVLAEEMLKAGIPIVVIDGMGIWWGLRVGKSGEGPGLPIVVFGGEHGDLPLVAEKAKQIARAIVQANISAVIDLSTLSKAMSRRILTDFLDELYQINRVERHVFIEETDLWAPQRTIGPEQATCLGSVDNFVRRGGNHNLGCSMITQRSAVLNKDILTQSDCLVVLRTLAPQDKKAIQAWVEEQTDEDRRALNEWYDSLKVLKNGEAWVWHPEKPAIYKKVMFRQRETFHATRTFLLSPKAGSIKLMDVNEFVDKFRNVFEPKPKPIPEGKPKSELVKATETVERKIAQIARPIENPRPLDIGILPTPQDPPIAIVEVRRPTAGLETRKPTLAASDRNVVGRILYAISQASFDERQTLPKALEILSQFGWLHERREVEQVLLQLCDLKFFTRKISSGNMNWYSLTHDAKQRIVLLEVNAA